MSDKQHQSNFLDPEINPCVEESQLSQKCLDDNFFRYKDCSQYFENYKLCKRFWGAIRHKRRIAGIKPSLPGKLERDEILRLKREGKIVISADVK